MKRLDTEMEHGRTAVGDAPRDEWTVPVAGAPRHESAEERGMLYQMDGVSKLFKRRGTKVAALDGVDLSITAGEFVIVMGSTGSGKSTLLMLLGALDRPTGGTMRCEGRELNRLGETELCKLRSRLFGFVFQSFNLIPTLTALENVETALVPLGVSGTERRERALAALSDVGLAQRAGHVPTELSGGEQQRCAIARALVKDPHVLLADEPTGNLDEKTRDDIVGVLESVWFERGKTLIVVTHDSTVAARAPRLLRLHEGRIVEDARQNGTVERAPDGSVAAGAGDVTSGVGAPAPEPAGATAG